MKRLLTLLALVLCSCAETFVGEEIARPNNENLPDLTAAFAEAGDTRTYIEDGKYLRWHEDDRLTIFYGNTLNRQYKFNGETGDNSGTFSLVPDGMLGTGNAFDHIYALYPYNADARITDEGVISLTLPAVQNYAENSFGRGANTMIAVTENLEDTFLAFKNACGYLKLKLYNAEGATIKSIEVKGNSGERLAGAATATIAFGEAPVLAMAESATDTITLNCGEGVALGTTAETATEFWFALPATTFAEGLTITATHAEGKVFKKSTTKEVVIERNAIQPMAALEAECTPPGPADNEIWYTNGSTTEATTPCETNVFGANIVSNTYDAAKECWVIKFDGKVTSIGYSAFRGYSNLTSITIPDSVTTIVEGAFADCSSLTSVTIGDSVTEIGDCAFSNCWSLTSITIPDSVTTIGFGAFQNCSSLTSITIPDSVTMIGDSAFTCCYDLTSITIGNSVTTIGGVAFQNCSSLTSVTIPDSVTYIGEGAFVGCSSLQEFNGKFASEDGRCLIIDGTLSSFVPAGLTKYTIPNSVTTIGCWAFFDCDSLTNITIPDSVTTIGDHAFSSCSSLTSVTIPDSVTTIGDGAFYGCSRLTSVTIPNSVTTIGDNAFDYCTSLTSVYCEAITPPVGGYDMFNDNASSRKIYVPMGSVEAYKSADGWSDYADIIVAYDFEKGEVVPDVLKPANNEIWYTNGSTTEATIPYETNAFGANIVSNTYDAAKECWVIKFDGKVTSIGEDAFEYCSLTSVAIPNSVTLIGEKAFYYCRSLTSVTIPDSVTTIGERAFYECSSLTSVTIPDSVTTMGMSAFGSCSSLTSITIPDGVTTIGEYAFNGCRSLTSVTIPDSVTTIGEGTFYRCSSLTSVTIPDSVTSIGNEAFYYCNNLTSVTIGDSVTSIGENAFYECFSLTSVTIPDSVTSIGSYAFSGCSSLTSVTIPDSVTSIGEAAFINCSSLTSVTIGDSVTTIGNYAFDGCESLTSVTIGDSVTSIGENAFYECFSLTSVTIPDSVTTIGDFAFRFCYSLTSVTIPDSVTTIGNNAFCDCGSLTSVTIGDSVTTIGICAFCDCRSLTSVTIPNSVTTIRYHAFTGCSSLTSVTIPDSVTEIEYRTFYDCSSLTSVTIPNSVTSIVESAFQGCSSLTSVTIPDSVTEIEYRTFYDCSSLTSVYCKAATPPAGGSSMFYNNASDRKIYVPMESVEAYKSADGWSEYSDYIVGYNFETGEESDDSEITEVTYTVVLNNAWRQSTSVSNPDSSLYDGVYESYSNYNKDNGVATMYIDIEGYTEFSIYVRSDAESTYDYVTVSELDSSTVKMSTSGKQNSGTAISNYTKVTYTGIDGGSHRIIVTYRKDGSVNQGTDRGYLIIPKNQ